MSEAKFTKGPWRVNTGKHGAVYVISVIGAQVAKLWNAKTRNANAHLIAAAPEMYEMLESLMQEAREFAERTGKQVSWADKVEQLLAKARGEV